MRCSTKGFTLMELLLVISLVSAMSFFLVRNSMDNARTALVDRSAAQLLDIKRAVLAQFVATGTWPDAQNGCTGAAQIIRPAIGALGPNPWGHEYQFICTGANGVTAQDELEPLASVPVIPSMQVRQQVPTQDIGRALTRQLPSTQMSYEQNAQEDEFFVDMYIPMVLLPESRLQQANRVEEVAGGLIFQNIVCSVNEVAKVALVPKQICGAERGLFGYRLGTHVNAERGTTSVMLEVRSATSEDGWEDGFSTCQGSTPSDMVSVFQYCESIL